jgi:hypothetical protein
MDLGHLEPRMHPQANAVLIPLKGRQRNKGKKK